MQVKPLAKRRVPTAPAIKILPLLAIVAACDSPVRFPGCDDPHRWLGTLYRATHRCPAWLRWARLWRAVDGIRAVQAVQSSSTRSRRRRANSSPCSFRSLTMVASQMARATSSDSTMTRTTQAHGHNTFENGHCTGPIYQRLKEAGRRFEDQKELKFSPTSERTCKFLAIQRMAW